MKRFRLISSQDGKYRLYQIVDRESGEVVSEAHSRQMMLNELEDLEASHEDLVDILNRNGIE